MNIFRGIFKKQESAMFCRAFIIDLFGKRYMLHVWLLPKFSLGWHIKKDGLKGKLLWLQKFD